jgi:ribose transport system ATP-binding protein
VPPHRESQGGFLDLEVLNNMTISSIGAWRHPLRLIRRHAERRSAEEMIDRLKVHPADPKMHYGALSGGNKQKVVFGRILFRKPRVYVLCEPTRGVDVGTRLELYRLVGQLRKENAAVLVVTSDSEDLFAVCDRIAVVTDGELGEFVSTAETNPQELEAFI